MILCVVIALVGINTASGLFLDNNPCDLWPDYHGQGIPKDPDFTTTIKVPRQCRNGTFRWDYPKGHAMVNFMNANGEETKICFGDDLGGDIFTVVDLTHGANYTLPQFERDSTTTVCTHVTSSSVIHLRIDAPPTMYYMGAMVYTVKS